MAISKSYRLHIMFKDYLSVWIGIQGKHKAYSKGICDYRPQSISKNTSVGLELRFNLQWELAILTASCKNR